MLGLFSLVISKKLSMYLNTYFNKDTRKDKTEIGEYKMNEEKVVTVKFEKPIATGMSLALGFFLMSIVLGIIGFLIFGLSCMALMQGYAN